MDKYLVEFFGTMFLVYVILVTGDALAIGAALAVAILVGGKISGGNFRSLAAKIPLTKFKEILSLLRQQIIVLLTSKISVVL